MLVRDDIIRGMTCDKVNHIVGTKIFLQFLNSKEHDDKCVLRLLFRLRMQAVVTIAAVILRIFLAEIMEQHLTTTNRRFGIGSRLCQQLAPDILFGNGFAFHKLLEFLEVFIAIESNTLALSSITSGTSCLLIIAFQTLGDIIMNHETHIGLVNTHTKGYSGHDDINILL